MNLNKEKDIWIFEQIKNKRLEVILDGFGVIDHENKHKHIIPKIDKQKLGNKSKYSYITIKNYKNHKFVTLLLHRIVWMYYHQKLIPDNLCINHIDGNKWNNHIGNLETISIKENVIHAYTCNLSRVSEYAKTLSKERGFGEKCIFSKLSDQDVIDIRFKFAKMNYNLLQLAEEYGVTKKHVKNLILGINFPHLPILTKKGDTKLITEPRLSEKEKSDIIDFYSSSKKDNQPPISMRKLAKVFNRDPSTVSTIIKNYLAF